MIMIRNGYGEKLDEELVNGMKKRDIYGGLGRRKERGRLVMKLGGMILKCLEKERVKVEVNGILNRFTKEGRQAEVSGVYIF